MERLKEFLHYNPETGDFTWIKGRRTGEIAGTIKDGHIRIMLDGVLYSAHKLAWYYITGEWVLVDHKDRKGYNNRIENLREATHQLNMANRIYPNGKIKGVYASGHKYVARISKDGQQFYLGTYDTIEEAAQVYKAKAKELFGEFASG